MRVDVIMPQMGESIAEGTITRWMKKLGDEVARDEPLFEISTDKVDAEIPAPSSGILAEIRSQEGETVPINEVVGIIETDADAVTADAGPPSTPAARPEPAEPDRAPGATKQPPATAPHDPGGVAFVSPVVRRIATEHGIDPSAVPGTGAGGRVTKKDILAFAEGSRGAIAPGTTGAVSEIPLGRVERVAMTTMRKKIAEHMVASRRTSAHVHSVFEVDLARVVSLRDAYKEAYEQRHGVRLTYTAFFVKAACDALRAWPVVNSSVEGDEIVYRKDLNIGIAVALDWGLIVPVVRNADELSMAGLVRKIGDLAERARSKKLSPDEVQGGTFTITNPGIYGGLFGLPIINQPQVAIVGVGGIEKRPVVVGDAIAIRPMVYLAMSYDHRVVDGAVADQFLAHLKRLLEDFDESLL